MKKLLISLLTIPLFLSLTNCSKNVKGKIIEENVSSYLLQPEKQDNLIGIYFDSGSDPFNVNDDVEVKLKKIATFKGPTPRYINGRLHNIRYYKILKWKK